MRGHDAIQNNWFSYVSLEDRIPKQRTLRRFRLLVDGVLASMDAVFAERYSHAGRPSIAPEKLLRALLLQVLYTLRSERQLMEQLDYNLLFRWFVGLGIDDAVWERSVFSADRERLLSENLSREFFTRVLAIAEWQNLVSEEHFSVDGSLIEAWASHKSFVKKDRQRPRQTDRPQPRGRLQRRKAQQRHPPKHDRSRSPALQERRIHRSQTALHHPCPIRESERFDRRCRNHPGDRYGRNRSRAQMIKRRVPKGG